MIDSLESSSLLNEYIVVLQQYILLSGGLKRQKEKEMCKEKND